MSNNAGVEDDVMEYQRPRKISVATLDVYRTEFNKISQNGAMQKSEVEDLLRATKVRFAGYKVRDWLSENVSGDTLDFRTFQKLVSAIRSEAPTWKDNMSKPLAEKENLVIIPGKVEPEDFHHAYAEEEKIAFVEWINCRLRYDRYLTKNPWGKYIPISPNGDDLFEVIKDGILLSKLINDAVPGTVDERALNYPKTRPLNHFKMLENQFVVLNSAVAIGCRIVSIRPEDMVTGIQHLQLAVLWQVIRAGLMANVSLKRVHNLKKLLLDGETLAKFMARSPEEILIRWVNYQLRRVCDGKAIKNFNKDIMDGEVYTYLLTAIAPQLTDLRPLRETDMLARAEMILEYAENLEVRYFVQPHDIVVGNTKLNTAFVAQLFNCYPALDDDQQEMNDDFDENIDVYVEETREEKSFRHWINSLNLSPYVTYLYEDLRDGYVLLQAMDKLSPGIVDWDAVNIPPFELRQHVFKSSENCNYVIDLGNLLGFKMIAICGSDIYEGNKLVLGLLWQMIRYYTLSLMKCGDTMVTEQTVLDWCNCKLKAARKEKSMFASFKDVSLRNSRSMLDLIDCIQPGSIGYDMVFSGDSDKDKLENARYGLTMARKIGATVFALPEDIVEGNHKMMLLVFARLMNVGAASDNAE